MHSVIRAPRFQRASMLMAASVIRLLKTDAAAFGDEHREPSPRLTAAERLERLRERAQTHDRARAVP